MRGKVEMSDTQAEWREMAQAAGLALGALLEGFRTAPRPIPAPRKARPEKQAREAPSVLGKLATPFLLGVGLGVAIGLLNRRAGETERPRRRAVANGLADLLGALLVVATQALGLAGEALALARAMASRRKRPPPPPVPLPDRGLAP